MSTVKKKSNRKRLVSMTVTALLIAIIVLMAFTPIGFLKIGPLELTLVMIPVIVGAVTQGPAVGAVLGAVFGIVSFIQCFTGSPLGAILVSESIPRAFIVCFAPRILTGFLCGTVYKVCAARDKKESWSLLLSGVIGSLSNTVLFLGFLVIFFANLTFTSEQAATLGGLDTVLNTVIAIAAGVNAPVELLVCAAVGTAVSKAVCAATKKMN